MTTDRRLLGAALGFALIVAACSSSSSSPTPSAAQASEAPVATQAAESPTEAPAASSGPSMPEISLTPGGASALESTLPDSAGGVTFTKTSVDGASIPGAGLPFDSSKLDPTLSKYGKTVADVKFAIATSSTGSPMVYALQLQGVPATSFMTDAGIDTSGMTKTTIGGKSVWSQSAAGMSQIVYAKDDVTYMILLATDAQAQAILAALP
jgi:hypothetical protein